MTRPTWCCARRGSGSPGGVPPSPGSTPHPGTTPLRKKDYGPEEPSRAARGLVEEHMAVSCPHLPAWLQGETPRSVGRPDCGRSCWATWPARSCWAPPPLYARLYRDGLLNRGFSYGYDSVPGAAFLSSRG